MRHIKRSLLVVTDSGGIQEEAPTFGKPLVVVRDKTERTEGVDSGGAVLVGTEVSSIVGWVSRLLTDQQTYDEMSRVANPYGDGRASERIAEVLGGGVPAPFKV